MRVAFYAPLKPPDHPVPSGDRRVARLLVQALCHAGHDVFIASRLRSYDGTGDPIRQVRLARIGTRIADRLLRRWQHDPATAPDLWVTYHLYYKAPDWLGPTVSAALRIPYVVAEASHAAKRAAGPWQISHRAVETALCRTDLVFGLNPADRAGVLPFLRRPESWAVLPPFLDARNYRSADMPPTSSTTPRLITVAMMRPGDKLASYRVLAAALVTLLDLPWSLDIIGDGPVRPEIEQILMPLEARVAYHGTLDDAGVAQALARADLFLWPAINEAFGMALLEAQASGLPVIAGASGGVAGIIADGETGLLVPPGDIGAFAAAARRLIRDQAVRRAMGIAARTRVKREHDLPVAAERLARAIGSLGRTSAA